jgi:hypothetical protein
MPQQLLQAVASTVSEETSNPRHSVNPYADFLLRVGERFGVPTVLLLIVLWWMKSGIVQPLLDAHFQVVGQIVRGQEKHAEGIEAVGEKLDELIELSRQK